MRVISVPLTTLAKPKRNTRHAPHLRRIDPRDFAPPTALYVDKRGVEFRNKPGRRKRLSAEQASLVFELQVQERTAKRRIREILVSAGFEKKSSRDRVLRLNWKDRGRIDVLHPARGGRP
jgi:hypothetical protein